MQELIVNKRKCRISSRKFEADNLEPNLRPAENFLQTIRQKQPIEAPCRSLKNEKDEKEKKIDQD